jgi:hypothetical protein
MKLVTLGLAAALAIGTVSAASAGTYDFIYTGAGVSGSGAIVTTGTTVDSVTGSVFDSAVGTGPFSITGLSSYAGSDNTFSGTSPYLTFGGLSFTTGTGGDFNLAALTQGGSTYTVDSSVTDPGGSPETPISLSISAVPEPSVWIMMLGGIAMMGAALRFGRKRNDFAVAA